MAAVHRGQQVGRLGLRGHAGGGPRPLDVDDHHGQLEHDREPDHLLLQVEARTARPGDPQVAAERGTYRRAARGDLVLGLEGAHAEILVAGQLVKELGGGGDRVARVEDG